MLNRIMSMFGPAERAEADEAAGLDALHVATCVLLLEVATADEEFSDEERDRITDILRQRFELSHEDAAELVEFSHDARKRSADLWKFTNHVNENCTNEEKFRIMEEVWRVIYADGSLHGHEDYIVHKMAKLLNLNHPQLIETKMTVLKEVRGE
jgi:uncharacterized tellurite resistance protein B-like protein